jgi:hypothetical protein
MHMQARDRQDRRRWKLTAIIAAGLGMALSATALAALPATPVRAAVLSPSLGPPNGTPGPIFAVGVGRSLMVSGDFVKPTPNGSDPTYFYNGPVSPSGWFEIQLGPYASGGCLSVNTTEKYLGYPTVTVQNEAGCDSGGNGYSYDHWSASIVGMYGSVAEYAFDNASEGSNGCMYLYQNVAIVVPCTSLTTDQFKQFTWPFSGLRGS